MPWFVVNGDDKKRTLLNSTDWLGSKAII